MTRTTQDPPRGSVNDSPATDLQDSRSQKGEVEFRRKLVQQQVAGEKIFADEFDGAGIAAILKRRMDETTSSMRRLQQKGLTLGPYLELGAERGQRSLVMENAIGVHGAAADLSFDMLASAAHWARMFGQEKLPVRVCCDIYTLPFLSNSLPFVFCYMTLHHFPDPTPILHEIHRVMSPGGSFLFDEEPFKRLLRLRHEEAENEVRHGIVENHSISIDGWKRRMDMFEGLEGTLTSLRGRVRSPINGFANPISACVHWLIGGSIAGLCRKQQGPGRAAETLEAALACPTCLKQKVESRVTVAGDAYTCATCGARYPIRDGVLFLLVRPKLEELYPEVAGS